MGFFSVSMTGGFGMKIPGRSSRWKTVPPGWLSWSLTLRKIPGQLDRFWPKVGGFWCLEMFGLLIGSGLLEPTVDALKVGIRPTRGHDQLKSTSGTRWIHHMAMGQYLLIPFLMGWTSIYQLFWCSPGVQGFDPSPYYPCDDFPIIHRIHVCYIWWRLPSIYPQC